MESNRRLSPASKPDDKKFHMERLKAVWPEVWKLMRPRRGLLAVGFVLMVCNKLAGFVLPYSSKFLIDNVVARHQTGLLRPIVLAVLLATVIQGVTSFSLTQLLSKAAQRLIAELRQQVQAHVSRLPVTYYDSNKTGALVSRIMSDVEGVRNLLGTGLVDLVGGIVAVLRPVFRTRVGAFCAGCVLALPVALLMGVIRGEGLPKVPLDWFVPVVFSLALGGSLGLGLREIFRK